MGNQYHVPGNPNRTLPTAAIGRRSLSKMRNKFHTDRKYTNNSSSNIKIFKEIFRSTEKENITRFTKRYSEVSTFCEYDGETVDVTQSYSCRKEENQMNLKTSFKIEKSADEIRRNYIAKLITNKIWNPNSQSKSHNSIIIFDWDDTLLPTSFLTPNGVFNENHKLDIKNLENFKKLESAVLKITSKSLSIADTYIITNAAPGWVEHSTKCFYPLLTKLLDKINIVSARGEYEKKYPNDSRQWKISSFLDILNRTDTSLVTNLICIGDSVIEMEAAHILASKFKTVYIKTVKLKLKPNPRQLYKQINLLIHEFSHITTCLQNLTVSVYIMPK
jgi:hypothetical protein